MPIFNMALNKPSTSIGLSWEDQLHEAIDPDTYVSASEALKNSDIYSLITQLSGDLATVAYSVSNPAVQWLIDNPTCTSNGHAFWQSTFAQLLLAGESFAYRWRDFNGRDRRWEYLRPSQVSPKLLNDGSGLIYDLIFDEPDVGTKLNVSQNDVIHFRLLSKNGGMTGISPLTALASELDIKERSNTLTRHALAQSTAAPGVLSVKNGALLDSKLRSALSNDFAKQMNSSKGPIVLDDLQEYKPLELKADVSKLLAQADWTGSQIAKVYGVSNSYLNGTGDQQSSIEMIVGQYSRTLRRYTNSITSELTTKLGMQVVADIRPAIDPNGDDYAAKIGNLTKSNVLGANQAQAILQECGYLPESLPAMEGGESSGNSRNQGNHQQ